MRTIIFFEDFSKKNRREVSEEEGKKFAEENKLIFVEASAKTGDNVEDVIIKPNFKKIERKNYFKGFFENVIFHI